MTVSSAATANSLPRIDIATLYGPMSVLGPLDPAESPDSQALLAFVDNLERTTRASLSVELDQPPLEPSVDEVKLAGDREEWQATLETCRQTSELLSGTKARVFRRWVSMKLPDRAAAFIQLQDRAIAHYQQMIAWLAFMLGEDDEMALQRSLVATDEAIRAPAPSVALNLG
jgi:hypothetical protein